MAQTRHTCSTCSIALISPASQAGLAALLLSSSMALPATCSCCAVLRSPTHHFTSEAGREPGRRIRYLQLLSDVVTSTVSGGHLQLLSHHVHPHKQSQEGWEHDPALGVLLTAVLPIKQLQEKQCGCSTAHNLSAHLSRHRRTPAGVLPRDTGQLGQPRDVSR